MIEPVKPQQFIQQIHHDDRAERQRLINQCTEWEILAWRAHVAPLGVCGNEARRERAVVAFKDERNRLIRNYLETVRTPAAHELLSELDWNRGYGICHGLTRG